MEAASSVAVGAVQVVEGMLADERGMAGGYHGRYIDGCAEPGEQRGNKTEPRAADATATRLQWSTSCAGPCAWPAPHSG